MRKAEDELKILVTGATGYVGGRLVPLLLERGHEVRTTTTNPDREQPWWGDRVETVVMDALDPDQVAAEHQDRVLTRTFLTDSESRLSLGGEYRPTIALMRDAQVEALTAGWSDVRQVLRDADRKSLRSWMR